MKILVVDDDQALRSLVSFALRQAGYLPIEADDAPQAVTLFELEQPDLVILDVNLPSAMPGAAGGPSSGFDVLHIIRQQAETPVLLLTVRNAEEDEVRGLDLGADDYMNKPFSPRTLLARVRALLRRAEAHAGRGENEPGGHTLQAGDLALDPENQSVAVAGRAATRLTKLEYRLLQFLLVNAGHTQPADRLTQHVWGYRGAGDRQMLKQLVHRLRQKIEPDPATPVYVLTIAGTGYVLLAPPQAHTAGAS